LQPAEKDAGHFRIDEQRGFAYFTQSRGKLSAVIGQFNGAQGEYL
jgi:hypothetical protein